MKNMSVVLLLAAFALLFGETFAQEAHVTSYGGSLLGIQSVDPSDWSSVGSAGFKACVTTELQYGQSLVLYGDATRNDTSGFIGLSADKAFSPHFVLAGGLMATPMALNQPSPFNVVSHFTPPSVKEFSSGDFGVLAKAYSRLGRFYAGVFYNDASKRNEAHVAWSLNRGNWRETVDNGPVEVLLAGYTASDGRWAGGVTLATSFKSSPNVTLKGFFQSDSVASLMLEPNLGPLGAPYLDLVYNMHVEQANWEVGWTKSVATLDGDGPSAKVLIGGGYRQDRIRQEVVYEGLFLFLWIRTR